MGIAKAACFADYFNAMYNPFARCDNYRVFTLKQNDLIPFIKRNDSSVASFFNIVMAKALDKVLPAKHKLIGGETAHNPRESLDLPDTHVDILSHIHMDFQRDMLKTNIERLGTMTRGQIILQSDSSVSHTELRKRFELYEKIDEIKGLKNKRKYMKKHDPGTGKDAVHGTVIVNYSGYFDWGELADYIQSYMILVSGHLILEISSLADKIFVCFMQMIDTDKYANAFGEVLDELGIKYRMKGPYRRILPRHCLPEK